MGYKVTVRTLESFIENLPALTNVNQFREHENKIS